jgi:hypothetical protein
VIAATAVITAPAAGAGADNDDAADVPMLGYQVSVSFRVHVCGSLAYLCFVPISMLQSALCWEQGNISVGAFNGRCQPRLITDADPCLLTFFS